MVRKKKLHRRKLESDDEEGQPALMPPATEETPFEENGGDSPSKAMEELSAGEMELEYKKLQA